MCRFIETIRVFDGEPQCLSFHEERMNYTREHFFPKSPFLSLADYWNREFSFPGVSKWRIIYGADGIYESTCTPYRMKNVQTLQLVDAPQIDYSYKYEDRTVLNHCFEQRGMSDDVLIIHKGRITDTSIANVALYDGKHWYTPLHPLLAGVKRRLLLTDGTISERDIRVNDLEHYTHIRLFNALIDWGELELPLTSVRSLFNIRVV